MPTHITPDTTLPTAAASRPIYCYVACADSGEVAVFQLNSESGQLSLVQTLALGGTVMPMAVSHDQRTLFVTLRSSPYRVTSLRINQTNGQLTELSSAELPGNMAYIALDRSGQFLLAVSFGEHILSISPVSNDGLVGAPICVRTTAAKPHSVVLDHSNQWLLVTSLADNTISQWRFDASNGQLSDSAPTVFPMATDGGPRHLTFSSDNCHVYAVNERDGKLEALRFDAKSGIGASEQSVVITPSAEAALGADIHASADGRFLYASERVSNTISGYRFNAEDRLELIGHFPTALQPRGFNLDPSGAFLVAAGQLSHSVMVHRIAPDSGALIEVGSAVVGKNPNWIEFAQP
ncbi:beta-propeller fold lactonase family protein [Glaciimonas sp. PAMC28666]|uniref:lactonase family protein n=1 Tax=Glaciimonas sp. PAMC28666 TaxID=2807626 RepID=UPI00196304B0|nr:beta-propeller fold lactonase family protein [Glaciimonas sp. PAMC28666]QRX82471.1 beta-propeller fold lactonase family protein [Glaciimonas sp. PAMC28666]